MLLFSANVGHDVGWGAASRRIACCGMSEDSGLCPGAMSAGGCDTHMLGVGVCALLCGHGDSQRYARVACVRCSVWFMVVEQLCEEILVKSCEICEQAPRRAAVAAAVTHARTAVVRS